MKPHYVIALLLMTPPSVLHSTSSSLQTLNFLAMIVSAAHYSCCWTVGRKEGRWKEGGKMCVCVQETASQSASHPATQTKATSQTHKKEKTKHTKLNTNKINQENRNTRKYDKETIQEEEESEKNREEGKEEEEEEEVEEP
ncbi:hypothetical protein E2C01_077097 [Portunus trituberculatus]|uniref:Secreted protein n=1 Tax=Portunus trituberculatus TaxID=210409 RepID=A0A5B7IKH9_PORTR|nr:hypothetical protein [Portunus trituberculatus]